MTNPKDLSFAKKKLIALGFISLAFSSFVYIGTLTATKSTKTIDKLDHVQGTVIGTRNIKHKYSTKRKIVLKNVLVLSIDGTNEEFGLTEGSDAYKKLFGFKEVGKPAKIYYDSSAKRIEQGVTLHIYALKIGNYQVVDIVDAKRQNSILTIIFFSVALIFLVMAIIAIKSRDQTQLETKRILVEDD